MIQSLARQKYAIIGEEIMIRGSFSGAATLIRNTHQVNERALSHRCGRSVTRARARTGGGIDLRVRVQSRGADMMKFDK